MMLTRRNKDGIMGTLCDSPRAIFIDYACAVVQEVNSCCTYDFFVCVMNCYIICCVVSNMLINASVTT